MRVTVHVGVAFWEGARGGQVVSGNIYVPQQPENFQYDADGNLTNDGRWQYVWDAENRLITMIVNTNVGPQYKLAFAYDLEGRRISKVVSTNGVAISSNIFLYDGWNLVATLSPSGALINSFMWGPDLSGQAGGAINGAGGVGGLLEATYYGASTTNCFPAYDGNGNIMALVNAANGQIVANYEYGPFGEVVRTTGPMAKANPFRFSTKYQDNESDQLYYGYRYYDPSTGRWPNRDPIQERGGLNLYGFVKNTPLTIVDKLGLEPGYGNPVSGPNGPVGPSSPYQPNPWPQPPGGGTTIVTVPIPDPNDPDNGFIPSNYQYIMDGFSSGDYLFIPVPAPGDPSRLNKSLKSVCGCIKNLTITGHGAGGEQNIGPSQSTGLGTIQVNYPHGQPQVNNIGIFDGVNFCKPCKILLDGCETATGVDWKSLFNAISQKTGCQVLGNATLVHPGGRGPLPGPGPFGPGPIGVQ